MVLSERAVDLEAFEQFIQQPEHGDTVFEWIEGRVYPVVSNNKSSRLAMWLGSQLVNHVRERQLGWVTGADGGYMVSGQRFIPDVGFITKERQPEPSEAAYNPLAPDLAVEVLSPTDVPANIRLKIVHYLRAGTTVWVIDPDAETVEVYAPETAPQQLTTADTLQAKHLLPEFSLAVADIFKE